VCRKDRGADSPRASSCLANREGTSGDYLLVAKAVGLKPSPASHHVPGFALRDAEDKGSVMPPQDGPPNLAVTIADE
jgi:hypothetical protein